MSILFRKPDGSTMLTGAPWKTTLMFALPLMLSAVLQNTYGVVDTFLVGMFNGEEALATVGTAYVLVALFQCTSWGFSFGINAVLSRYNGANDEEGYRRAFHTAVTLTFIVGLFVVASGLLFGEWILRNIMGIPGEIMDMACGYFYVSLFSVFFSFIYNTQGAVLRSLGNSRYLLQSLLCTSFLNIALDVLFVGVMDLGVVGAAAATAVCSFASVVALSIMRGRGYPGLSFRFGNPFRNAVYAKEIIGSALPMVCQQLIIFSSYAVCQNPINSYGVSMTAAFGVERSIESVIRIPMTAFGAGMLTFSGTVYGAGDRDRLIGGVRQIWLMSMCVTAIIGVAVGLLSPLIVGMYPIGGLAYDYAVEYVRVVAFTLPLFTAYFAIHGFFQGIGKPIACTIITFTELLVRVIVLYTLGSVIGYGVVWWSVPIAWSFAMACSASMFVKYRRMVSARLSEGDPSIA